MSRVLARLGSRRTGAFNRKLAVPGAQAVRRAARA